MLCFCFGLSFLPSSSQSHLHLAALINTIVFQKQHVAISKASTKSLRYAYLMHVHTKKINGCVPPAYVSCQISAAIVTQQVGKCHCSLQRLEQGCHTLYRSLFVWLILTGPIHHCWARCLSPQHNHRNCSNFSTGWMLIRFALPPLACCLFPYMCPLCLFILLSWFVS